MPGATDRKNVLRPMTNERDNRGEVRRDRFGIAQMLILVAGIATGFWVMRPLLLQEYDGEDGDPIQMIPVVLRVIIAVLGGISLVGVPLLLLRRRRDRTRWGPGQMAWFAHGTATWLLWPPILITFAGKHPRQVLQEPSDSGRPRLARGLVLPLQLREAVPLHTESARYPHRSLEVHALSPWRWQTGSSQV